MMVPGHRNRPKNALERTVVRADVVVEVIVGNQIRRRPRKGKVAARIRTSVRLVESALQSNVKDSHQLRI